MTLIEALEKSQMVRSVFRQIFGNYQITDDGELVVQYSKGVREKIRVLTANNESEPSPNHLVRLLDLLSDGKD